MNCGNTTITGTGFWRVGNLVPVPVPVAKPVWNPRVYPYPWCSLTLPTRCSHSSANQRWCCADSSIESHWLDWCERSCTLESSVLACSKVTETCSKLSVRVGSTWRNTSTDVRRLRSWFQTMERPCSNHSSAVSYFSATEAAAAASLAIAPSPT